MNPLSHSDTRFSGFRQTLDAEMKQLHNKGLGTNPKQAESILLGAVLSATFQNKPPQPVSEVINWHRQQGCADRTSTIGCLHTASSHPFLLYRNSPIGSRLGALWNSLQSQVTFFIIINSTTKMYSCHIQHTHTKVQPQIQTATTK